MLKEFAGGEEEEEEAFLGYESVTAHLIHTQVPVLYSGGRRPEAKEKILKKMKSATKKVGWLLVVLLSLLSEYSFRSDKHVH